MKHTSVLVTFFAGLLGASQTPAQDIKAGEALYKQSCRECHGSSAGGLAGQSAKGLIDRLQKYRAGEQFGPSSSVMVQRAKKLSDSDIEDVSHFLSSLK